MAELKDTELHSVDIDAELPDGVIKRFGKRRKIIIAAAAAFVLLAGGCMFLTHHTFSSYITTDTIEFDNSSNNDYAKFGDNILKYSRDGAALLDEEGNQMWNQAYQMSKPVVAMNGNSFIIADQGGNTIEVFDEAGEKGSIRTGLPIEKVSVSGQGITAAILSGDSAAEIICYDTAGNILVEDKVTVSKNGYPVDVALSDDGTMLLVSCLLMESRGISTRLVYYDFSDNTASKSEKMTMERVIEDTVFPEVFYMKDGMSAAIGEYSFLIYGKGAEPQLLQEIKLDKEIHSVAYSDEYIAFVLENPEGDAPYELRVYNTNGKIIGSTEFKGDFSKVLLDGRTIILDAGTSCKIFTVKGVCVYDGALEDDTSGILPVSGIFKYAIMRDEGISIIRLIK